MNVVPRDGLRVRFHVVRDVQRLHLSLDHDAFAAEQPVVVSDDLARVQFTLENRTGRAHETGLTIAGLPPGEYTLAVDGRTVAALKGGVVDRTVGLPISGAGSARVVIARQR